MSEGIYLAVAGAKGRPGSRGLDREHPEGIQAHPGGANVDQAWLALGIISGVVFALTLIFQKREDVI